MPSLSDEERRQSEVLARELADAMIQWSARDGYSNEVACEALLLLAAWLLTATETVDVDAWMETLTAYMKAVADEMEI